LEENSWEDILKEAEFVKFMPKEIRNRRECGGHK
jgi:hypothetical protein